MNHMKRILATLTMMMLVAIASMAEDRLNIDEFFSRDVSANPKVTLIDFNGRGKERFSAYRSISVSDDRHLADRIAAAVAKDGSRAVAKEVSYKEGVLYYGFYSMGGKGKHRRYILYLNRRPTGKEKTTLVYLEADLDADEVKRLINR